VNELMQNLGSILFKYWQLATLFSLLIVGLVAGVILRRRPAVLRSAEKTSSVMVYALLFLLGISAGSNKQVVGQIGKLGYQAMVITVFAVIGSLIVSYVVYRVFFKNTGTEE